jgi:diaminopimelate epimerase
MSIPFVKMQGLGNDFVVIDDLGKPQAMCHRLNAELAQAICDRRFGIGADQILWLKSPEDASLDARMEILNSDGSTAEMCGNGIRAVAIYLYRHGPKRQNLYQVETLAGVKQLEVRGGLVSVDMGPPILGGGFSQGLQASADSQVGELLSIGGRELRFFEVNMGNPHAVFFVEDAEQLGKFPVEELGALIEKHPRFPRRTNVEFVAVTSERSIQVRVWERGAGITLACGTGACASAVASLATGRVQGPLQVNLPGGILTIDWRPGQSVMMEGPAEEVFRGDFYQPDMRGK